MKRIKSKLSPDGRLRAGAQIVEAAQRTDTTLVHERMTTFTRMDQAYALNYDALAAVKVQIDGQLAIVAQHVSALDAAVEDAACVLAAGGQSRRNPFGALGFASPSLVKKLSPEEKAQTIRRLVGVMEGQAKRNAATRRATATVDEAVSLLEKDLQQLAKLQTSEHLADAAHAAAAKKFDGALSSLKFDARAAAHEGAPGLYKALFGRSRPKPKAAAKPETPPAAVTPTDPKAAPAATADTPAPAATAAPASTPDTTAPAVKPV